MVITIPQSNRFNVTASFVKVTAFRVTPHIASVPFVRLYQCHSGKIECVYEYIVPSCH